MLAEILGRKGKLKAKAAENGEPLEDGTIYVAVPNHHLLIGGGQNGKLTVLVSRGPRENRHRPAVDPLFRSAALAAGAGAVGVVLSGTLDDGTAGLIAIKECGGIAVVQDPKDAMYPGMPQSALDHAEVDHVVPIAGLAPLLARLVDERPPRQAVLADKDLITETKMANLDADALQDDDQPGRPSPFSCPDCGGVLWEIEQGDYTRYRCRVGHAYSPETMLGAQDDRLEEALWTAVKTLEENAHLSHRLADSERQRGNQWLVERFEEKEREARQRVEVIRRYLLRGEKSGMVDAPEPPRPLRG